MKKKVSGEWKGTALSSTEAELGRLESVPFMPSAICGLEKVVPSLKRAQVRVC